MLKENTIAPNFELLNDENQLTRLLDFKGQGVVLFFFPKALTRG